MVQLPKHRSLVLERAPPGLAGVVCEARHQRDVNDGLDQERGVRPEVLDVNLPPLERPGGLERDGAPHHATTTTTTTTTISILIVPSSTPSSTSS